MRTAIQETTYRIRNSWAQSQEFDNLMTYKKLWRKGGCKMRERTFIYIQ
jgi:hypothetical protein